MVSDPIEPPKRAAKILTSAGLFVSKQNPAAYTMPTVPSTRKPRAWGRSLHTQFNFPTPGQRATFAVRAGGTPALWRPSDRERLAAGALADGLGVINLEASAQHRVEALDGRTGHDRRGLRI